MARERGSRLRLKLKVIVALNDPAICGKGAGISPEIETHRDTILYFDLPDGGKGAGISPEIETNMDPLTNKPTFCGKGAGISPEIET